MKHENLTNYCKFLIFIFAFLVEAGCQEKGSTTRSSGALESFFNLFNSFKSKRDVLSRHSFRHMKWTHSTWLGEPLRSPRLYWSPGKNSVDFRVDANTIGGIVLGFNNEDFVVLWVDDISGKAFVEVSNQHAFIRKGIK